MSTFYGLDSSDDNIEMTEPLAKKPRLEAEELPLNDAIIAELHEALIKYAMISTRLLFIERSETWKDFHSCNKENGVKFMDLSIEQLRNEFIQKVLPNIFTFTVPPNYEQRFHVLQLHPEFRRVENGFERLPPNERVTHTREPRLNIDYRIVDATTGNKIFAENSTVDDAEHRNSNVFLFDTERAELPPSQTLISQKPFQLQRAGFQAQMEPNNAALISAVLSSDYELSACKLLEPEEMLARMRAAKIEFEQTGRMPVNCIDASELLQKIETLKKLRDSIVEVVTNKF